MTVETAKELYRFVQGDSDFVYTVTSSDEPETYNSGSGAEVYAVVPIGRGVVEGKNDMSRQNLTVSLSIDNVVARDWFTSSLDFPITLTVFSKVDGDVEVEWKGRLASVSPKKSSFDFVFESVFTSMRRMGLRQRYQIGCPHALYGPGCKVNKESFDTTAAVTLVAGSVVTVPAAAGFASGYFTSGIFEDNAGNLRFITKHVGSTLTLIRSMNPLIDYIAANGYTGLTCRIFPGCNRSVSTCNSKFNNLVNYGGFPFMPIKNPFSGGSIV